MTDNRMYSQRAANIPVMRFCDYRCSYCAFQKFQKISSCQKCKVGENHSHLEVLSRKPPKSHSDEFITVGLAGDVSFMPVEEFWQVIEYCRKWKDRTFLIQSKNPAYFLRFQDMVMPLRIPDNVILGTTIETNRNKEIWTIHDPLKIRIDYTDLSRAPAPYLRTTAMVQLQCRKAVTIEPIMDFDVGTMLYQIKRIAPEFVYIGYVNDDEQGKRLRLPEPPLEKTLELIARLREAGVDVREKTLRKAFYE